MQACGCFNQDVMPMVQPCVEQSARKGQGMNLVGATSRAGRTVGIYLGGNMLGDQVYSSNFLFAKSQKITADDMQFFLPSASTHTTRYLLLKVATVRV